MNRKRIGLWSGVFLAAGTLHLVKPEVFDSLVPTQLPGTQRQWTLASGVAELGLGASIAATAARPNLATTVAPLTAAFLVAVLPGNIQMAINFLRSKRTTQTQKAIAVARVPLQIPMIYSVLQIGK